MLLGGGGGVGIHLNKLLNLWSPSAQWESLVHCNWNVDNHIVDHAYWVCSTIKKAWGCDPCQVQTK